MRIANVVYRVLIVSNDLCLAEGKDASPVKTGLGLNADSVILLKECLTGDRKFSVFLHSHDHSEIACLLCHHLILALRR